MGSQVQLFQTVCAAVVVFVLQGFWPSQPPRPRREPLGLKVVACSDTHGKHRDVTVPEGDVFIHAGDFTEFGKEEDVLDFNEWLGELPHKHKFVINGNHENNAKWK